MLLCIIKSHKHKQKLKKNMENIVQRKNLPLSFFLIFLLCFFCSAQKKPKIEYHLSMKKPHTHYFHVKIVLSNLHEEFIDLFMPVWAPGSYLVREFSRNIEGFKATTKEQFPLKFRKLRKNIWRVFTGKQRSIAIFYKVYAYKLSVRTSYLDISHGYINGSSVFMGLKKYQGISHILYIDLYSKWRKISTTLDKVEKKLMYLRLQTMIILLIALLKWGITRLLYFIFKIFLMK